MKTFLDEIAEEIVNSKYPFESVKVVVPSRRASLFLKNALARQIQKPAFAPEIVSIENFVEELSVLKKVAPVDLIFEFYAAYQDVSNEKQRDSFDQFLGWATVIYPTSTTWRPIWSMLQPSLIFSSRSRY